MKRKKILVTREQLWSAVERGKGVAFGDKESAKEYAKSLDKQGIVSANVELTKGDKKLIYVLPVGRETEQRTWESMLNDD